MPARARHRCDRRPSRIAARDAIADDVFERVSPKLRKMMGWRTHAGLGMVEGNAFDPLRPKRPIGELSMSRPAELTQDFDW
eukprot:gene2942-12667_t